MDSRPHILNRGNSRNSPIILANVRAFARYVNSVNRLTGDHEQTISFFTTKTQVGANLGQQDRSDSLAIWRKNVNAVEPAPTQPAADQILPSVSARIPSEPPNFPLNSIEQKRRLFSNFVPSLTSYTSIPRGSGPPVSAT